MENVDPEKCKQNCLEFFRLTRELKIDHKEGFDADNMEFMFHMPQHVAKFENLISQMTEMARVQKEQEAEELESIRLRKQAEHIDKILADNSKEEVSTSPDEPSGFDRDLYQQNFVGKEPIEEALESLQTNRFTPEHVGELEMVRNELIKTLNTQRETLLNEDGEAINDSFAEYARNNPERVSKMVLMEKQLHAAKASLVDKELELEFLNKQNEVTENNNKILDKVGENLLTTRTVEQLEALALSTTEKANAAEQSAREAMAQLKRLYAESDSSQITAQYLIKKLRDSDENWRIYESLLRSKTDIEILFETLMEGEHLCARDVLVSLKVAKKLSDSMILEYDRHLEYVTRTQQKRKEESNKWIRIMVDPEDDVTMKLAHVVGIDNENVFQLIKRADVVQLARDQIARIKNEDRMVEKASALVRQRYQGAVDKTQHLMQQMMENVESASATISDQLNSPSDTILLKLLKGAREQQEHLSRAHGPDGRKTKEFAAYLKEIEKEAQITTDDGNPPTETQSNLDLTAYL